MTGVSRALPGEPTAEVRARAVEWFVLLASGRATAQDRQDLQAWCDADPTHAAEWTRVERVQQMMMGMPSAVALPTLRREPAPTRRKILLRSVFIAAAAGGVGYGSWQTAGGANLLADASTAPGEQRRVTLSDGSVVTLNTATAIDIRYDADWRALTLRQGEILVETATALGTAGARDPRPLVVDTAFGRVRALGTRFLLRLEGDQLRVAVLDSAVETRLTSGQTLRLAAGQQTTVDSDGFGPLETVTAEAEAWTYGSLIVDNVPLGQVVAELARYRRGRLACDPRVAGLRVSGAFPVKDVDQALAALQASLPVQVRSVSRFWVTVGPKGA